MRIVYNRLCSTSFLTLQKQSHVCWNFYITGRQLKFFEEIQEVKESFILNININKTNKETQTTRLMVGKTEFMAPLYVLHQCPTSQPKHAVLQHLQTLHLGGTRLPSEITFKSTHLHSDT